MTEVNVLDPILNRIHAPWFKAADISPGWNELVLRLDSELAAIDPSYEICQVKQKFGGLRYYVESDIQYSGSSLFWHLIHEAEVRSTRICEDCGSEDDTVTTASNSGSPYGYILTLCGSCRTDSIQREDGARPLVY